MRKLAACLILVLSCPISVQAEDIMSILQRQSESPPAELPKVNPYNYTLDVTMSGQEGDDIKPPFKAQLRINPAETGEKRGVLISTSSDDYSDDFTDLLDEIRDPDVSIEDFSEEFWCEGLSVEDNLSLDDFTVVSQTQAEATIRPDLQSMAKIMMDSDDDQEISKSERKMMKKMMERLDGEFILSKPEGQIKQIKIWMTRPMRVMVIAKINTMEVQQSCAPAPNGLHYTETISMNVGLKALGVDIVQNTNLRISDLTLR